MTHTAKQKAKSLLKECLIRHEIKVGNGYASALVYTTLEVEEIVEELIKENNRLRVKIHLSQMKTSKAKEDLERARTQKAIEIDKGSGEKINKILKIILEK